MVPVALFVYNRPAQTKAVLKHLKANRIPLLYVYADGARPGDEAKVQEVHKHIDSINWTRVKVIKRKNNIGLSLSIRSGLDEVFKSHSSVIIVEDDIQVASGFYEYMCSALSTYEKIEHVAGVTGLRYPFKLPPTKTYSLDTFIYPRFSSWGWGTWKKEWQDLNWNRAELIPKIKSALSTTDAIDADMLNTFKYYIDGKLSGAWDVDFAANMVLKNKVFAWPTWNMVFNGGLLEGTHASGVAPPWKLQYEKRRQSGDYKFATDTAIHPGIKVGFLRFFKRITREDPTHPTTRQSVRLKSIPRRAIGKAKRLAKKSLNRRTALVSYLVGPLQHQQKGVEFVKFSNEGIAVSLAHSIKSLGLRIKIINWNDTNFTAKKKYDLVILHGGVNLENIKTAIGPKTKIIYFATGCYWQFHNAQEKQRLRDFKRRHGIELPRDRYIESSEEEANSTADAIICLGNAFTRSTFDKFKNVYSLNIGSYKDEHYDKKPKDIEGGRKNFLFFSGDGNIHKGLDLLLDVFAKQKDLHLYVCTNLDKEFAEFYKEELYNSPNIHYMGYVITRSKEYYGLVEKCNYAVLPSCSEGSPGSVVDSMQQGLIPVVSKEAGLDTMDYGVTLEVTNLSTLEKAIKHLPTLSAEELMEMSKKARSAALEYYSPDGFESNFKKYINEVLEN